jgi:hypothetical protein
LPLKKDLGKIGLSYLACEIVDLLNAERVENHLLFKYLNEFLESLSAEGDKLKQKLLSVGFQFKVIDLLGFFSETLITSENDLVIIKKLIARDFNQMAYLDVDKVSFDKLELIAAKLFEEIAEKKSKSRNFFNLIQRQ